MNDPKLILASHNSHKLLELRTIIESSLGYKISDNDIKTSKSLGLSEPKEDGATFKENATIKAKSVFDQTNIPAIADDSGLIVELFQNAPGILSARWSGVHGDDEANNKLLLNQLKDLPIKHRRAYFVSSLALFNKTGDLFTSEGVMKGVISEEMAGQNGFGYDSIFIPDDYADTDLQKLTNAQLSAEQKNAISHRSKALKLMVNSLKVLWE